MFYINWCLYPVQVRLKEILDFATGVLANNACVASWSQALEFCVKAALDRELGPVLGAAKASQTPAGQAEFDRAGSAAAGRGLPEVGCC